VPGPSILRRVPRSSDLVLEGAELSDERRELAFAGAQLSGHREKTVGPARARDERRQPHTAAGKLRNAGRASTTAALPIDPDGAASAGAYRDAMLTPKVISVSSTPTAHPSSATRPAASARQGMAAPARR
jgi:hypothetical protein